MEISKYILKSRKNNKIVDELSINYVNELVSISDFKFYDFEYDLKRNKLYLDFSLIYTYIDNDNKPKTEKYNSLIPEIKRLNSDLIQDKNKVKQIIFEATLIKSLLGFCSLFLRLFKNVDIKYNLINLYNRIDDEFFSIMPNIRIFKNLLNI